jgi:hypothetical protein
MKTIVIPDLGYTKIEKRIIDRAYREISNSNYYNKSRHCSILTTSRGFILCSSINKEVAELHSEYACLRKFNRMSTVDPLSDCFLFNVRISRHNEIKNSKPCCRCSALLKRFTPRKVFFTNDEGVFEQYE